MSRPRPAANERPSVAVVFGGVSPEHEVSIISGLQALAATDAARWDAFPLYVAKDGSWWSGPGLCTVDAFSSPESLGKAGGRVTLVPGGSGRLVIEDYARPLFGRPPRRYADVVFPVLHGGAGEDGGIQGLCDLLGVPYVGSGVLGSAVGMDKIVSKQLCERHEIPVVDYVRLRESEWADRESEWLDSVESRLGWPLIVKPSRLGSSIGISRADNRASLDDAVEEAFRYDGTVVIEKAVTDLREINCSVLGDADSARASVLEEPVSAGVVLSFRDKYLQDAAKGTAARGSKISERSEGMASLDRIVPAPLGVVDAADIRDIALRVFHAFDCSGVARIDFLMEGGTGKVYFNEINTIPGSLSFYLWEPSGVSFSQLVDTLLHLALKRHRDRTGRLRTYGVNLLSEKDLAGLKGAKTP